VYDAPIIIPLSPLLSGSFFRHTLTPKNMLIIFRYK